jgi:dTDP-4-dehydrorhamnose 3,5-epimerase
MAITVTESGLPGVLIVDVPAFGDERGFFMETYRRDEYAAAGIADTFVQDNHSRSAKGVLRGIHFQVPAQAKLVRCTAGALLDVAVDLRAGSPAFGRWVAVELSAANRRQLYVPAGFGHAFLALAEGTELQYRCSEYYAPEGEGAIRWDDPDLGIAWPIAEPVVSARDGAAQSFRDYAARPLFHFEGG